MNARVAPPDSEFAARLRRVIDGQPLNMLDLFSGCGGMTLGFLRAGFNSIAGVEIDKHASRSHAMNFHKHVQATDPERFERMAAPRDITQTDPLELLTELGFATDTPIDIIVGGPPCPAFTRVGRAKLREVHAHPEAFKHDPRWRLYLPYLEFVRTLRPLALVMENVPDLMNFGGHNLAEDIADDLTEMGYRAAYTLINAVHHGVPQMRDRFILVAFDERLGVEPVFPEPTHHVELPRGYVSSRNVATRALSQQLSLGDAGTAPLRFIEPAAPSPDAQPAVTIREALADLSHHVPAPRGRRRLDVPVPYRPRRRPSAYAKDMRNWPGFATEGAVTAHVTRALKERDGRIFAAMKPGDDYPAAHRIATALFEAERERRGKLSSADVDALRKAYVPPYDVTKFPNKWRKMDQTKPARTLMAHLGKDSYTHIHYDDAQRRVLTVREAARLQSFPDGFEFSGTMNPGFRQIGNAVPPLMAYAIAKALKKRLLAGVESTIQIPEVSD